MTIRTRMRQLAPVLVGLSAVIAGGCSAGGEKPSSTTTGGSTTEPRLTGKVEYEFVPYNHLNNGLDYSNTAKRPIRGARVLLLDASNDNVLAETVSTKDGAYTFDWSGSPNVKIWVYAETTEPQIAVADNTVQNAKYILESAVLLADEPKTLNLVAKSGWTGSSYGEPRQAAPFAILDAAYQAARRFIDEATPKPNFPKLEINWSVENRPEDGNLALGQIGTSFWDGGEIYILGKEDVDTDEFDTHVIVHEWGHSFEDFIARSDSQGGSHGFGDILDPRLAFSEGFCNALSGIILEPDTVYSDSSDVQQKDGFSFDVDENDTSAGAVPGWFSETTAENIVFDVYDGEGNGAEPFDNVALGIPGIYGVVTGGFKTTPALTSIFPFVSTLKTNNASSAAAIDALVTHHKASGGFGIDPVVDEWGTNESHTGGDANALPVYTQMKIGDSKTVTLTGGLDWALLGQNRFLRFTGNGASVTVSTSSVDDVDLYIYKRGKEAASSATTSGNESAKFTTTSGEEYVINVQGFGEFSGPYDVVVAVKP